MAETINGIRRKTVMAKIKTVTWKNSYWDFWMEVNGQSHNIICRKDDENASVLRCDFNQTEEQTEKSVSVVTDCINTICHYMSPSIFQAISFLFNGENIVADIHYPNLKAILSEVS